MKEFLKMGAILYINTIVTEYRLIKPTLQSIIDEDWESRRIDNDNDL